jgi:excisionase family DNA binding protein
MSEFKLTVDVFGEARRAVFMALDGLQPRERSRAATAIVERLRAAGLLARGIEYHYSATDAAKLIGRSDEYVTERCMSGELSPVMRDGRGWLIPASTLQKWLDEHTFREK